MTPTLFTKILHISQKYNRQSVDFCQQTRTNGETLKLSKYSWEEASAGNVKFRLGSDELKIRINPADYSARYINLN